MTPVLLSSFGCVTPVGLTAAQSCAAIRAGVAGFREGMVLPPPADLTLSARIPASRHLKCDPQSWLANLAARALRECLAERNLDTREIPLLIAVPEPHRQHSALARGATRLLHAIEKRLESSFHPKSVVIEQGRAGVFAGVNLARQLLERPGIGYCLVGGVDSLINRADVERLSTAGRLHEAGSPQGVVPGEGAAFVLLTGAGATEGQPAVAQLLGLGGGRESDDVLGERQAAGVGLRSALTAAVQDAQQEEARIDFRVSDMNGERFHAWDSVFAANRFYRTRREQLSVWYPAMSTGDIGAAAGALNLIFAANAIARGFAPGPVAICEGSSDEGLRAACLVGTAPGARVPPFRFNE